MALPQPRKKELLSHRLTEGEMLTPEELTAFMTKQGLSDQELAEIFGVTSNAVLFWRTGQRAISVTNSRLIKLFMRNPLLMREF